jgi:hypothetical protein
MYEQRKGFTQIDGRQVFSRDTRIADIPPIGNTHSMPLDLNDPHSIHEFVLDNIEQPLQRAVESLLLNGVRTNMSSANGRLNILTGYSFIDFDLSSVSVSQRRTIDVIREHLDKEKVPQELPEWGMLKTTAVFIQEDARRIATLAIPTDGKTTLGFIEDESMKFAQALADAR